MLFREDINKIKEIKEYLRKYNTDLIQTESYNINLAEFTLECIENIDKELKDIYTLLEKVLDGDHK